MKVLIKNIVLACSLLCAMPMSFARVCKKPKELIIIGSGMAGGMEAYAAYEEARKSGEPLIIRMFEKNKSITQTTVYNLVPSLTPDEIISVVPRGPELVKKLAIKFNQPGGIKVVDIDGVHGTPVADHFISQAERYSKDESGHQARTQALLELGKMSMDMWQQMYDQADDELKEIFKASNFNPCCEPSPDKVWSLHNGYRIDLIYNVTDAYQRAASMVADYQALGYKQCRILSPKDVIQIDPFLQDFCDQHAHDNQWNNDTVALWRPGGCLDAQVFLPRLYDYLAKAMGTYSDDSGNEFNAFEIHYGKKITSVMYDQTNNQINVVGLVFQDGTTLYNDRARYVFCPGEAVGTLRELGFNEPAYAGFAGVSLLLSIEIPQDKYDRYKSFSHCMEVHQEGVVLAWQARHKDNKIFIGVAGTKAFYADKRPTIDDEFAQDRNLLQLNMINDVLPEFISDALGYNTRGKVLTHSDLDWLQSHGIAKRWAGVRAVVFDGFPTLGYLYKDGNKISNARCTTHLGSGGVSFARVVTMISRAADNNDSDDFVRRVLLFSSSIRNA